MTVELPIIEGLAVEHAHYGKGVVLSANPQGAYVVVQYCNRFLGTYLRTHPCEELAAI